MEEGLGSGLMEGGRGGESLVKSGRALKQSGDVWFDYKSQQREHAAHMSVHLPGSGRATHRASAPGIWAPLGGRCNRTSPAGHRCAGPLLEISQKK